MNRIIYLLASFAFLLSCEEYPGKEDIDFLPMLVVDGRIESGGFANVFITRSIPYFVHLDSSNFSKLIIRHAKVTLSDGVRQEILTLKYDKELFPPYYYRGTEIRGEPGKTYSLTIDYGDLQLEATTTIPWPVPIFSGWFQPTFDDQDKGNIQIIISDTVSENFYRFYTSIHGKQDAFYPTLMPNFEGQFFKEEKRVISLSKGPESYVQFDEADFRFSITDTVIVKVCTMDAEQFEFWRSYASEVTGGANPFAASSIQLQGNIHGGLGNWGGFGVSFHKVDGREKTSLTDFR